VASPTWSSPVLNKWLGQLRNGSTSPTGDLWRHAVDCGHGVSNDATALACYATMIIDNRLKVGYCRNKHQIHDICKMAIADSISVLPHAHARAHTHTHTFNGHLSGTTQVSRYQKGKTNLDSTEARDSEWQWHQLGHIQGKTNLDSTEARDSEWQWHLLGHIQVCTLLRTDNHTSTPPLCFLQAGCPSCRPTNSVEGNCELCCTQTRSPLPLNNNSVQRGINSSAATYQTE